MISWSSSFASSTPETSLNVTFFCELDDSFARLLPNDRALFPPLCICRMMKIQNPIIRRIGAQAYSSDAQGLVVSFLTLIATPIASSLFGRPSYWAGASVLNLPFPVAVGTVRTPVISLPVMVTEATSFASTWRRNFEKVIGSSLLGKLVNCQIRTPTTTRTIQNNRLLRVEFNLRLLNALLSRVSRLVKAP